MTYTNDIIGTDELSRPITRTQLDNTSGAVPRIKLLSEIVGPLQPYLQDCLRLAEVQHNSLEFYRKQTEDLRTAIIAIVKNEIGQTVERELEQRSDSLVTMDEVRDCISDELVEHIHHNRRFRNEIVELCSGSISTSDIKEDIQSDIERDLEDKVNDLIAGYDFGDMLDDHTRDIDEKIVKRLVDEISDDPKHPLIDAIASALAARLTK